MDPRYRCHSGCGPLPDPGQGELEHDEWGKMVEEDLPFGESTARMLMAIVRHPILSNRDHGMDKSIEDIEEAIRWAMKGVERGMSAEKGRARLGRARRSK